MTPLRRLFAFLRRLAVRRAPAPIRRETGSRLEPLEPRIAPATLVSPHIVTYQDGHGDIVTIKSSLPIFTSAAVADQILSFNTGKVADHSNAAMQVLKRIDLSSVSGVTGNAIAGDSLSITDGGRNHADVGLINSNHHLGNVLVQGDLGRIIAGEAIGTGSQRSMGLVSLSVHSLGVAGNEINASSSLVSTINGALGSLLVQTDFSGATLNVMSNTFSGGGTGNIGSVRIGGGLIGGIDTNSGSIFATGKIGSVSIAGTLQGGEGNGTGTIISTGALRAAVVHGSILGGNGDHSGGISGGAIGSVTVEGALRGHTFGNYTGTASTPPTALDSGQIVTTKGSIGSVTLGDLIGGGGSASGAVIGKTGIGHLTLRKNGTGPGATSGSVIGGIGDNSGQISAPSLGGISIAGLLQGGTVPNAGPGTSSGTAAHTGEIVSTGSIAGVAVGGIAGGSGLESGSIVAGSGSSFSANLGSLRVTGDLAGGTGDHSGEVNISGTIGTVAIGGSLAGNAGLDSGSIFSLDSVTRISLGKLIGGSVASSGQISVGNNLGALTILGGTGTVDNGLVNVAGTAGAITIKGDVVGNSPAQPGEIRVGEGLKSLAITGKLQGLNAMDNAGSVAAGLDGTSRIGSAIITGGIFGGGGISSGQLFSGGSLGHIATGPITGGAGSGSGSIVTGAALGSVVIRGDVTGGGGQNSGQISSGAALGSLSLHGMLKGGGAAGSGTIASHTLHSPDGDLAGNIAAITITGGIQGGSVANTGEIIADGNIRHLSITGDVTGTAGVGGTGAILANHIGGLAISGALKNGSIRAYEDIASLAIGSLSGQASQPVVISAAGQASPGKQGDFAFGKISIGGDVSFANLLAGYDPSGSPVNGSASIGTVMVKGNWEGSNLVAGVEVGAGQMFGTSDNSLIPSSTQGTPVIAGVTIEGHIESTPSTSDHYGFVARKIDAFSVAGHSLKLSKKPGPPVILDPTGTSPMSPDPATDNDTAVREVIF